MARYRAVIEKFAQGGGIQARELQQLETLRQHLGLSRRTHDRLLAERDIGTPEPVTLHLYVDVSTIRHFAVDSRCMLRLKLENHGDLALESVEIRGEVFAEQALESVELATLFPGHSEIAPLWLTPRVAGFQELRGDIHTVDLLGESSRYRFDRIQFRVGAGAEGTRVSVVNIDQRSARVVDNSRQSFAAPAGDGGGLVAEGEWHPVPLQVVYEPAASRSADPASADRGPAPAAERISPSIDTGSERVDFRVTADGGEYRVDSTLAGGDLATVYGGRRMSDGVRVAVKVADDAMDNDLMLAEYSTLCLLRDGADGPQLKHLPRCLGRFRTGDGRLGSVFEHIDGHDLYSVRERLPGGIPARHIIWLLRRCLSVLGWAHSRGVIHGNVDPAHIMLRPHDHNVWLVDWCYSIVNPAQTGQGFRCFNEEYSAPEVARRKPPLPSSELYSLGKCMIFAAGGDPGAKTLPDDMDERLQRFIKFFVLESPLGRAQDAWALYSQLDRLRARIYGPHKFVKFEL